MISSAWSLISSSTDLYNGARRMTSRVRNLLSSGQLDLNDTDRRLLLSLQKRVECLVQPLNFLLLWSKNRDSCVQQAVLSAQELLVDVCSFVERFVPQDSGGPGELEYYLRELEFACASVSMAVSIARATEEVPQQVVTKERKPAPGAPSSDGVSLSALLRASRRIQEMRGRSGDLCACPGRLYVQQAALRGAELPNKRDSSSARAQSSEPSTTVSRRWQPVFSLAVIKVVVALDPRSRCPKYSLSVESRLALNQTSLSHDIADDCGEPDTLVRGLNADGPLTFPIEVALDACLRTTAQVPLPSKPAVRELGISTPMMVWSAESSVADGESAGAGRPSSSMDGGAAGAAFAGEEAGQPGMSEFPDAVFLAEERDNSNVEGPGQLRCPNWRFRSASSPRELARNPSTQPLRTRYAFVFDGVQGTGEARAGDAEVALTPLDAIYLTRLCALDAGQQQLFQQDLGVGRSETTCPPHLLTSDEVLLTLLRDVDGGCASALGEDAGFPTDLVAFEDL